MLPAVSFITLELAYNGNKRDQIFSIIGSFRFIQVLLWILGTPVPRDRKVFPKKTGLRSAQVPFKRGFSVYVFSEDLL